MIEQIRPIVAWKGARGVHLHKSCPDLGGLPRRVEVDPRTVRCSRCILWTITAAHPAHYTGCGSHAGYNRHKKAGERPCFQCSCAEADYQREAKRRQRERMRMAS